MQKKLHWFIDSISMYSLFMNLQTWLTNSICDTILPKIFKSPATFLESIPKYKISGWLISSFLRYIVVLRILQYQRTTNFQFIFYLPSMYISVQKVKLIYPTAPKTWQQSCNLTGWEHCEKLRTIFYIFGIYICMPKIKLICQFFVLEEVCNLIGWEHF